MACSVRLPAMSFWHSVRRQKDENVFTIASGDSGG
jgi:hypothetical protein